MSPGEWIMTEEQLKGYKERCKRFFMHEVYAHCEGCGQYVRAGASHTEWKGKYNIERFCKKCGQITIHKIVEK